MTSIFFNRLFDKLITIVFLSFIFISVSSTCLAQKANGIKFETGLSFVQIKEKAETEKKYIFIDNYTTWCIPCKKMESNIFPLKDVGDFFNKHFINYKVQIDSTKDDSFLIKNAYDDAEFIKQTYQVTSYPTYLVLNPEGVLLHRFIGSVDSAKQFIDQVKIALNPITQGYNLVKEFENGRRDSSFLKLMIDYGTTSDRKNRALYVQCFLKTQKDLLTPQNMRYILQSVASSKDIGYDVLINHPNKVIEVVGKQWRDHVINNIIFDEHILPFLRKDGKKQILDGGMYVYKGEIIYDVKWTELKDLVFKNFKDRSDRLLINAETSYYSWTEDWQNLNRVLLEYSFKNKNFEEDVISNWLSYFTTFAENQYLSDALVWSSKISDSKNLAVAKNRAILYYKIGKTKKSITTLLRYQKALPEPDLEITKLIAKLENGEKLD